MHFFNALFLTLSLSSCVLSTAQAATWEKAFPVNKEGQIAKNLGYTNWPDNFICVYGANTYHVQAYARAGTYGHYSAFNTSVGIRIDNATEVITNIGYCGNLNGLTVQQAIDAGYTF